MLLDGGSHGVLEELVEDVVEMGRRVTQGQRGFLPFLVLDQSLT